MAQGATAKHDCYYQSDNMAQGATIRFQKQQLYLFYFRGMV